MKFYAFQAMCLARHDHANQRRKYTGNPYADHLAEVAGITCAAAMTQTRDVILIDQMVSVAWLHDWIEDQRAENDQGGYLALAYLQQNFNHSIASGVWMLSDHLETGSRAQRKAQGRERLSRAPWWVQTVKVADLISNTSSIVQHDPEFAATYLEEKRLLLDVLTAAVPDLVQVARAQTKGTSA